MPSGALSISMPPAVGSGQTGHVDVQHGLPSNSLLQGLGAVRREAVGVEALQVREAPRLLGRVRERQRSVALEKLGAAQRRVPPVEDQRVAVGVCEERHVADTGVAVADELHALLLELGARGRDIGDSQRDPVRRALRKIDPLVLRFPDRERHVSGLELGRLPGILGQPEHVAVERDRALDVPRRDVDEIDTLDLHHPAGA